ncbi:diaminopimelate epimerase [Bacillus sp. DNRA2]|uniref:diaminopimelate epimerase n=1 Tax=Bacillus sp. DNRA2 TaxID=2723053 RepID=UPI00145D4665|nr:diaminopimelate epimerase [Bacillus sp. DNRA2]
MNIEVLKVHGSGNDFLLIDEMTNLYTFSEEDRARLAIAFCNRDSALGADGILFVLNSETADARMRVFNADGSEASMCGNGLRCVARYVCEKLKVTSAVIETMKANLQVEKEADLFPEIPTYKVEISPVTFQLKDLPLNLPQETVIDEKIPGLSEDLAFTAIAVPNPHIVAIVNNDQLNSDIQLTLSEYVNGINPLFPDGVNVSFVKPIEKGHIFVRTFERGVGFTNACGTAMSASSLVTCLVGLNNKEEVIEVYNPGGKVRCIVHEQLGVYKIDLIGNGTYVYEAVVKVAGPDFTQFSVEQTYVYLNEAEQYEKLQDHAKQFITLHQD